VFVDAVYALAAHPSGALIATRRQGGIVAINTYKDGIVTHHPPKTIGDPANN